MTINLHQIKSYIKHFLSAKRKGHDVHSPFAYQLCEEVFYNYNTFYDFEKFDKIRTELLKDRTIITVKDLGAGSKTLNTNKRSIASITSVGISTKKQSEILYKLINFINPETIIELGTSVGLNTLYLSSSNKKANIYSVEGNEELTNFAKQLATTQNIVNCNFITGNFDSELPKLLNKLNSMDLIYIDGNHTYEATIKYFEMALAKKNNNSVFIFDDIYWSQGMTKAWEEIKKRPAVTMSIDTFYFGMLFFRVEVKERVELKFLV